MLNLRTKQKEKGREELTFKCYTHEENNGTNSNTSEISPCDRYFIVQIKIELSST